MEESQALDNIQNWAWLPALALNGYMTPDMWLTSSLLTRNKRINIPTLQNCAREILNNSLANWIQQYIKKTR